MKVRPIRKNTDISKALLDDFFKGDENYTGTVQAVEAVEEERSEHDKHWNGNMLVMQYSNENAEMKKLLQELVDIGYSHEFQAKYHRDLFTWVDTVNDIIYKAQELLGGEHNEYCLHKKDCIDGANFKYAKQCERFVPDDRTVIKALECCNSTAKGSCLTKCPYYNYSAKCSQAMINDTLDLINRQQAEIKKLQEHIQKCEKVERRADELIAQLQKELKTAKSEAVKEFVGRLEEKKFALDNQNEEIFYAVDIEDIDNLVKEMGCSDAG